MRGRLFRGAANWIEAPDSCRSRAAAGGRDELCRLKVKDFKNERRGVAHLKVLGKGGKTRYMPLHPAASGCVLDYLEAAGHLAEDGDALFRGVHHGRVEGSQKAISADADYKIVRGYSKALGFEIGAHSLRATAATNRRASHQPGGSP